MSIKVSKIRKTGSSTWYELPSPLTMTAGIQTLDGNSGRDTGSGKMYRDVIRNNVADYKLTLPEGITNVEMRNIIDIILSDSYEMYIPDVKYGGFTGQTVTINGSSVTIPARKFYTASFIPDIKEITSISPPAWTYKEVSFDATEY